MITSFLYSVSLSLSGTGISYDSGPAGSSILYNFPSAPLSDEYTVVTATCAVMGDPHIIIIDNSYDGQQIGIINQDRSSFLFTFASAGGGTASETAAANYYDNVGPVQRALVQGYLG